MKHKEPDAYIKEALFKIISNFNPEKIILFGSFAYGHPDFNSDIDLLVVMNTALPPYERAVPIRKALRDIGFPFDIIVKTPYELICYQDIVGTIAYTAIHKGKILYEHT
ncbi:MAG: nucleotidyltransferase domain-containing protein [Candidatus Magnetoovum sp. WYHC-5]|nr:nucleotidyltransferase domain-containing protein [Candidatus Magnetoovum sp. WYHC-5]